MSAERLRRALGSLGLAAEVEARDRLAVLRTASAPELRRVAAQRSRVAALAMEHGFTHVALEIGAGSPDDAALPRD